MGDTANLLLPSPGSEPNTIPLFDFKRMTVVNVATLGSFFILCWMLFVVRHSGQEREDDRG